MKSLSEKREELSNKRAMRQCSSGCEHTDKVWQRHLKIGFEDGFDAGKAGGRAELFQAILTNIAEIGLDDTVDWIKSRGEFEIADWRRFMGEG